MAFLAGLSDYLSKNYDHSTIESAKEQATPYSLYLHGHSVLQATISDNRTYDILTVSPEGTQRELQKIEGALSAYQSLPDSRKKRYIYWLQSAKREDTKQKRIKKIIEEILRSAAGEK